MIVQYLLIPWHHKLCVKFGWIINLIAVLLCVSVGMILIYFHINTVGRFFERYAVFIAGYWLASGVKKECRFPLICGFAFVLLLPLKILLHFPYLNNEIMALTGFGICYLFSVLLDVIHISFINKIFAFLGTITLETYMLNVSFNWILKRLKQVWYGVFPTYAVYWCISGVLAVVIAFLIHKLSSFIIKKISK